MHIYNVISNWTFI